MMIDHNFLNLNYFICYMLYNTMDPHGSPFIHRPQFKKYCSRCYQLKFEKISSLGKIMQQVGYLIDYI